MFGYVTIRKDDLKVKDYNKYQAYYCGLCQDIKEAYGKKGQAMLTFDMTFLSILLTGLYECETKEEEHYCFLHPGKKHKCLRNKYTKYCADMNVLLAEDNELNAEIAQTLLESEGVVVTRAANGNEVVDLYLSHPAGSFDAILMDIMMPGMDGYEATRTIRLSEKVDAADIPIIALTANALAEDAKAAHDAGMNAHLSKPLDFNKLKNILARIKKNGSVSL